MLKQKLKRGWEKEVTNAKRKLYSFTKTLIYTISSKQNPTRVDFTCMVCCHIENFLYDTCPCCRTVGLVTQSDVTTVCQAACYVAVLHPELITWHIMTSWMISCIRLIWNQQCLSKPASLPFCDQARSSTTFLSAKSLEQLFFFEIHHDTKCHAWSEYKKRLNVK